MATYLFFWLGAALSLGGTLLPIPPLRAADEVLRIGITVSLPLVIDYGERQDAAAAQSGQASSRYGGIAVELWKDIAAAEQLDYQLQPVASDQALHQLQQGQLDVLLAVVPQADLVDEVHYTQPFLTTHLAAMTDDQESSFGRYAKALFNSRFWTTVLWLSGLLLALRTVCWSFERRVNENQ